MTNKIMEKMWNILKENDFQIDDLIKSEFICTSCKNVVIKPCQVPCGCRYCYECLENYLNGKDKFCLGQSEYCKSESISFDNKFCFDQVANIKISRIVVKCPVESCEFKTELGKMADHLRTCDRVPVSCPYYAIGCDDNKIDIDKMDQHFKQENYCHAKLLMDFVDNWKNEVKLLKSNMLELKEENKWIKEQMESKQKTILALEENVAKLLQENRCFKELETEKCHRNNEYRARIERISTENRSLRDELNLIKLDIKSKEKIISALQRKSEEEEEKKEKLKVKCEFLERSQEPMKTRLETLFQTSKSLKAGLETVKQDNKKQEDRINKMSLENAAMTKKFKESEAILKIRETKLSQIQVLPKCDGFLWCIENWFLKWTHLRWDSEIYLYSDPFYSHKKGYKMRLLLFYCGIYNHKNSGLCMCIMKGEFDNSLQWPIKHDVKYEVIDDMTRKIQFTKIVEYDNSENTYARQKPITETNDNNMCSYFYFNDWEIFTRALCKTDKVLIKATVILKP